MSANSGNWVWGLHAVRAVLASDPQRIAHLRVASARRDDKLDSLARQAREAGVRVSSVDARELERLTGDAVHQGVLAEVRPLRSWNEEELLAACGARDDALLMVLDGVQDPHNLGACVRTANACGAIAVVVPRDRAAQLNATVRKVAAGAAEFTPVVSVTNLARTLQLLKDAGLWIVGADAEAQQTAAAVDLKGKIALVLGAEGAGLRQLTRNSCDWLVSLPLKGEVESLNVSVAAGMLLYEALRQRGSPAKPTKSKP
jgi:23S rRNA (guanosine2251-2'-O)-methyltransferase